MRGNVDCGVFLRVILLFLLAPFMLASCSAKRETVHAPRYNEQSFRGIRPGMSKNQVLALLGPPISKESGGLPGTNVTLEMWRYTRQHSDADWWLDRSVAFSVVTDRVVVTEAHTYEP